MASLDPLDLAPRLTLALFLYEPSLVGEAWIPRWSLRGLALLGLLRPPLHRSPWLWGAAAFALAAKTAREGFFQDNHVFLLSYWSLALAIAFAGCNKSLAAGVPMAGVLFPAATVGFVLLPVMLYHQFQLMVCAALAQRYGRRPLEEPVHD